MSDLNPASDVATYLAANLPNNPVTSAAWVYAGTGSSGTTGASIFIGPPRIQEGGTAGQVPSGGIPGCAIFVCPYGGPLTPYLGGHAAGSDYHARLQITVRGPTKSWLVGYQIAQSVRDLLHKNVPTTSYYSGLVQQAEPVYMGDDVNGNSMFVVNLILAYTQVP
jgi:Bacteriophage minor capsid protein